MVFSGFLILLKTQIFTGHYYFFGIKNILVKIKAIALWQKPEFSGDIEFFTNSVGLHFRTLEQHGLKIIEFIGSRID